MKMKRYKDFVDLLTADKFQYKVDGWLEERFVDGRKVWRVW